MLFYVIQLLNYYILYKAIRQDTWLFNITESRHSNYYLYNPYAKARTYPYRFE